MLKMRLQRVGRKHEPTFRLVLTDSKNSTKSGRFQEILGSFDPRKSVDAFKTDRVKHWLDMGIALTPTVHNLFVSHKLLDAKKKNVLPRKTPIAKEEPKAEAPSDEPVKEEVTEAPEETANVVPAEPVTEPEPVVEAPTESPAPTPEEENPSTEVVQ